MAQIQPTREVKKGEGAWVTETFTNPIDGKLLKATSYTRDQLDMMLVNIEKEYQYKKTMVEEMITVLG